VTELYQAHAVGLIKLGVIMLGDRTAAEDVVQDAFFGLYRNWGRLSDPVNALAYARQRAQRLPGRTAAADPARPAGPRARAGRPGRLRVRRVRGAARRGAPGGARRGAPAADRQREALVLRFYLGVSEEETARAMEISRGTVKSSTSRALAALGRMLKEES
jgi:DNA-directed RNA polymerase specialized sigma24 family protein